MTRSPHPGAPTSCHPKMAARRITVSRGAEAGPAPSSVRPTGVGLPKGGPAPRRRTARRERGLVSRPRRAGKYLRGRRGESRVLGSRAIHECSCRKSVAEVGEEHLPRSPTRGAARQTEGERGSTDLGLVSWTRPSRGIRAKGCEERRANVTGIARLFPRPQGRGSNRWKASWARPGITSNRVASSGVLAW
jgi:hypothetical protein